MSRRSWRKVPLAALPATSARTIGLERDRAASPTRSTRSVRTRATRARKSAEGAIRSDTARSTASAEERASGRWSAPVIDRSGTIRRT
jgi:hypothetical protein